MTRAVPPKVSDKLQFVAARPQTQACRTSPRFSTERVAYFDQSKQAALRLPVIFYGTPGRTQTFDLLIRSQTLYSTELRVHDP